MNEITPIPIVFQEFKFEPELSLLSWGEEGAVAAAPCTVFDEVDPLEFEYPPDSCVALRVACADNEVRVEVPVDDMKSLVLLLKVAVVVVLDAITFDSFEYTEIPICDTVWSA